ncbi:predicted protein [Phaeodactylum tricornutum CCAP 1055/1]|jgi:hypothetical protein|uniref:Uncharacterized protein n=1 Tax=Phaeodactylum tricornutum (strain CCAP 1055/1) TaxID=556484 RepID=B7FY81_PHATC|nr:predicted protein [Phaeodactylum tricornutum CCAP 1055/1]EEC48878.1 predicted protein [Phaeodactylum tricornutum CCAP 1055/1]|eukprot:XP_002179892.1 predicted protein [Phaeodactylum tricornutum CCAP 1055/1]
MIVYAMICRAIDAAVLVEFAEELQGNAPQVTSSLMESLRDHPELVNEGDRKTYVQRNESQSDIISHFLESCAVALGDQGNSVEEFYFHLFKMNGIFYCCIGDDPDTRDQKVNFAFLEHICNEFVTTFRSSRIESANAYSLDKQFKPTLRSSMHHYNTNHKSIGQEDKVRCVLAQVEDMKAVMGRNINLLLSRGEDLNAMSQKSDTMQEDAMVFKKNTTTAAWKLQRQVYLYGLLAALGIVLLIYMISISVCGARLKYCRSSRASRNNSTNTGGN